MIKAKLIKLDSISNLPEYKIYVKNGEVIEGQFENWPSVDSSFVFWLKNVKFSQSLITSTVREIVDERTFKTRNSIYKIVTQEDERDNKIEIIIS